MGVFHLSVSSDLYERLVITSILELFAQGRRSRGGWGGYCPPKYRGGGAQPPLALPSGYE